jgi:hypothetical protein
MAYITVCDFCDAPLFSVNLAQSLWSIGNVTHGIQHWGAICPACFCMFSSGNAPTQGPNYIAEEEDDEDGDAEGVDTVGIDAAP